MFSLNLWFSENGFHHFEACCSKSRKIIDCNWYAQIEMQLYQWHQAASKVQRLNLIDLLGQMHIPVVFLFFFIFKFSAKVLLFSCHLPEIFTIMKIHSWFKIVTLFSQIRKLLTLQLSLSFALNFSIFLAFLCGFHVPTQFYVSLRISFWSLLYSVYLSSHLIEYFIGYHN